MSSPIYPKQLRSLLMCDGHVATRMFFGGFVMLCSIFFVFIDTSQIPTRPFYDILTYWHYHAVCLQMHQPYVFLWTHWWHQRSHFSDLDIKGCEANLLIFEVQRVVDSLRLSADLHATWHPSLVCSVVIPKKKAFFASKEACSKISASEMVSLKKASLRRNPAEIHQCLRVFESGLQPVRMQFTWWHVSCSWKACIAKCNRGTGTLAVSCNFCGGAVSSSGALAYFKELVK